jgi:pimeloyl-ACP methyl ester carboxylesterase
VKAFVVDAGVMGQFVDDGDAHLFLELHRIGEVGLEGQSEERDLVGQRHPVGAVLGAGHALVETVEPAVGIDSTKLRLIAAGRVLDDDGHIVEQSREVLRQAVEGALDERLEGHVLPGCWLQAAFRMPTRQLAATLEGHGQRMARCARTYALPVSHVGPNPESMVVQLQTGERIHYLAWAGGAGVPLVLIHGLTRTAWTWLPIGRRLAAGHPVIAPDLRGHGASDAPLSGYELESLALDVLTVVAGAGWGEAVGGPSVVVAGHGLGAMIGLEMARLQPDSVRAVALLDGGWEEMVEATRMLPDQLVEAMAEPPEVLASMDTYLADRRDFDPASWDADQETAARAQVTERHAGHVGLVTKGSVIRRCVAAMYGYQPLEQLAGVRAPVTVLVASPGTADDEDERERRLAVDDAQQARAAAGGEPMAVRYFEGVGHDLMRHRPEEVSAELERLADA